VDVKIPSFLFLEMLQSQRSAFLTVFGAGYSNNHPNPDVGHCPALSPTSSADNGDLSPFSLEKVSSFHPRSWTGV